MPYPAIAPTFGDIPTREREWTLQQNVCQPIPADPTTRDFYYIMNARWRLKIPRRVGQILWTGRERAVTTAEVEAAYEEAGAQISSGLSGQARANAMNGQEGS